MITIGSLIDKLKEFDPNLPVMMPGYGGGVYDGPTRFQVTEVAIGVNDEWYLGPHEIVREPDYYNDSIQKIKALVIR